VAEVCGPGGIPGEPEAIRDAARGFESSAKIAEDAPGAIRSARANVLAGWDAPSAAGFEAFATRAESCAASLVAVGPAAAAILRTYAEELAAAKRAFRQATRDAESAERDLDSADSAKAESQARDDLDDARGAMGEAGQAAVEANHRAAAAIRGLADGIVDPPPIPQPPAPGGSLSDGELTDLQRFASDLFSTGAAIPDAITVGLFGQGVQALGNAAGGDWQHLMNPDSLGYRGVELASMATFAGALRRAGREALEEGGERAVRSVADDAAAYRAGAASDTTALTRNLEREIGVPKPAGSETHHLVPKGEYSNRSPAARDQLHQAQAQLQRLKIGPDDAPNGAFLPRGDHRSIHTDRYFRVLNERLARATSSDEAADVLARIRKEVTDGRFPH